MIATSIYSIRSNSKTKKLLIDSQAQQEKLHMQEEEMRQNLEELIAIQEDMNRKTQTTN